MKAMCRFRQVFHFRDPDARGRCCILIFTVVEGFLTYVTSGIFYTGFLKGYGIDIVHVGILNFIPYLANLLVIFTPALLNRFPRRKWILAGCKFLYYLIILVGQNLLPHMVADPGKRIAGLILLIFLANLFNVIATSGYAAWHIRFQPQEIRAYYLTVVQFLTALVSGILVVVSGFVTDSLAALGSRQLDFIVHFRYFAFFLAVVDVIFLLIPREVSYPVLRQPRLGDILSIPLHNKKFLRTMLIVFLWQFSLFCYASFFDYYLIDTIHISYLFYNLIVFLYSPFFILFMGFFRQRIERSSWFRVFASTLLIAAPLQILYGFVQPGDFQLRLGSLVWTVPLYIPLICIVRLPQHFAGVGHNVAFANLQYINMPLTNRECYTSFYQIVFNLGSLAGLVFGTVFVRYTEHLSFTAFGYTYLSGVPLLPMISGVIQLSISLFVFLNRRKLEPDTSAAERA